MNKLYRVGGMVLVALLVMSCAIMNNATSLVGGKSNAVTQMWSDVPQMDGLTRSNSDLPLPIKVVIQSLFKAAGAGADSLDFISFTTDKTPADLSNYYTVDRMTAAGWNESSQVGCNDLSSQTGSTSGVDGVACIFARNDTDNKGSVLAILGVPDSKTKQMTVYFARMQLENLNGTPTP